MLVYYNFLGESAILPASILSCPYFYNGDIFTLNDQYYYGSNLNNKIEKFQKFMLNKYFDKDYFLYSIYYEKEYKTNFNGVIFKDDKIANQEFSKRLKLLNIDDEMVKANKKISFSKLNKYKNLNISFKEINSINVNEENK